MVRRLFCIGICLFMLAGCSGPADTREERGGAIPATGNTNSRLVWIFRWTQRGSSYISCLQSRI